MARKLSTVRFEKLKNNSENSFLFELDHVFIPVNFGYDAILLSLRGPCEQFIASFRKLYVIYFQSSVKPGIKK